MPPNAVIDASVLVSAFLFPESVPGQVVQQAEHGIYRLHISPILTEEVRRSLRHPRLVTAYGHDEAAIEQWCAWLHEIGQVYADPLPEIPPTCRDPDDDHVLAAAIAVRAHWIVTGDKDLLALVRHEDIRIVTARQFLEEIAEA